MGRRNPISTPPPSQAGDSLREWREQVLMQKAIFWAMAVIVPLTAAASMWWAVWLDVSPLYGAVVYTVFTIGLAFVAIPRIRDALRLCQNISLGLEGEVAVGHALEQLRAQGYEVLHDIPGQPDEKWNIDHVLIGPTGIYAIETKTHSIREGASGEVVYDGETVTIDGSTPRRDPVKQARANAKFIHDLLAEHSDTRPPLVRGVVIFPGRSIKRTQHPGPNGAWVLKPEALPIFLEHEPTRLSREQITRFTQVLAHRPT